MRRCHLTFRVRAQAGGEGPIGTGQPPVGPQSLGGPSSICMGEAVDSGDGILVTTVELVR